MLYHPGALRRLNDIGELPKLTPSSSVSGGSITAGVLARAWKDLRFDAAGVSPKFRNTSSRRLTPRRGHNCPMGVLGGILRRAPRRRQDRQRLSEISFRDATLQDLPGPPAPLFVINATNLQSGALWRFTRAFMADYRVGLVRNPRCPWPRGGRLLSLPAVPIADDAQGRSAALRPAERAAVRRPALGKYMTKVFLTDGGVYDNLGLETAWKRYKTVLVSDGGGKLQPDEKPDTDWVQHAYRVNGVIDNQVRSLRKRLLIESYELPAGHEYRREGTYWGIRSHVKDYDLPAIPNYPFTPAVCDPIKTERLANTPTRLSRSTPKRRSGSSIGATRSATWRSGNTWSRIQQSRRSSRIATLESAD